MKKFFSFLLAVLMLLSLSVTAFASTETVEEGAETGSLTIHHPKTNDDITNGTYDWTSSDPAVMAWLTPIPDGVTNDNVAERVTFTWTSSDENIVTVAADKAPLNDGSGTKVLTQLITNTDKHHVLQYGKMTPHKNGTATITVTASTGATASITVTVNMPSYTVTYLDSDGGNTLYTIQVYKAITGDTLVGTLPDNPTREGYKFVGWFSKTGGVGILPLRVTEFTADSKLTANKTVYAKWEKSPEATVGETPYDTVEAAVGAVEDNIEITVNEATTIAGVEVAANSTVTVTETANPVSSTVENATATVTPKTLTITSGEESKTAKAYVVSNGSGENEVKAVVTNVAKDGTFTNETSSTSVESYINVAQVLANAVAANATGDNAIDISSISSMTLSLKKTAENTLPAAVVTAMQEKNQTKSVAFEVHPVATVTTKIGDETSTTTYDVSNKELANNASFTFKLTGLTPGKSYTLYHYSREGGLKDTFYKTANANGEVTLTLSSFSYIVGEEIANPETINAVYMSNLSLKESLNLNFYIKLANGVDKSNAVAKVTFNGITTEHPLSDASTVTLYGNTTYKVSQTVVARMMFKTAVLELYVNGKKVPLAKYTGETTAEYVGTAYTDSVDAFLTRYASQYANDSLAVDLANATRAYGTAARAKLTDN